MLAGRGRRCSRRPRATVLNVTLRRWWTRLITLCLIVSDSLPAHPAPGPPPAQASAILVTPPATSVRVALIERLGAAATGAVATV